MFEHRVVPPGAGAHCTPETAILTPSSWTVPLPLEDFFDMSRPLEVEIGCGKGRFLCARAQALPHANFLGIDRLLVRLRRADRKIVRAGLRNVRLLRIEAGYAFAHLLPAASVRRVYVFFPDPWPKRRHHPRRLIQAPFLEHLSRVLVGGGEIHVKTDHDDYFETICGLFDADTRFRSVATRAWAENETTEFERFFVSRNTAIRQRAYCKRLPTAP